jgi:hypothetical protein
MENLLKVASDVYSIPRIDYKSSTLKLPPNKAAIKVTQKSREKVKPGKYGIYFGTSEDFIFNKIEITGTNKFNPLTIAYGAPNVEPPEITDPAGMKPDPLSTWLNILASGGDITEKNRGVFDVKAYKTFIGKQAGSIWDEMSGGWDLDSLLDAEDDLMKELNAIRSFQKYFKKPKLIKDDLDKIQKKMLVNGNYTYDQYAVSSNGNKAKENVLSEGIEKTINFQGSILEYGRKENNYSSNNRYFHTKVPLPNGETKDDVLPNTANDFDFLLLNQLGEKGYNLKYEDYFLEHSVIDKSKEAKDLLKLKITDLRSRSIEFLLNSGSDFFGHMFDVMLLVSVDDDKETFKDFFTKIVSDTEILTSDDNDEKQNLIDFIKADTIDSGCFMVRTGSIEVPQMENEVFDMKFLFGSVKKQRSKVKFERKAELKLLMDEPLILMDFFNLLSNNNQTLFGGLSNENRIPRRFATYSTNRIVTENLLMKKVRIDLIIKHQKLQNLPAFETLKQAWGMSDGKPAEQADSDVMNFGGLSSPELPLWLFEDVNFLGQGTDLVFDRDSANIAEISYPFLFKRCIKINREFKGGYEENGVKRSVTPSGDPIEGTNASMLGAIKEKFLTGTELGNKFFDQSDQEWFMKYLKSKNKTTEQAPAPQSTIV